MNLYLVEGGAGIYALIQAHNETEALDFAAELCHIENAESIEKLDINLALPGVVWYHED